MWQRMDHDTVDGVTAIGYRLSDRDLRILDNPTADNLNPQETTSQDSIDMGQEMGTGFLS